MYQVLFFFLKVYAVIFAGSNRCQTTDELFC